MIQQSYDSIINKIISKSGLSKSDIEQRVQDKLKEMQDLISREGAAHIIANELKVKLFDSQPKDLKLKDIQAGENSINTVGKVLFINEIREFISKGRKGRVASLVIADETKSLRLTIWDEKVLSMLKDIKKGDIVKIHNTYSRDNNGNVDLHLGSKSQLILNPPGVQIEAVSSGGFSNAEKKQIKDLQPNEFAKFFATIVNIFEPRYYQACPVCNKKVLMQEDSFRCEEHAVVSPKQVPIVNVILDDNTGNIRAVCFRDVAEQLIGKEMTSFDDLKSKILGKQMVFRGKVIKNEMFDRIEFRISGIEEADPKKMIEEMNMG